MTSVKDRLPDVEHGHFLVLAPQSFPKNSPFLVAAYYADVKGFYGESSDELLSDVTHWMPLPEVPK